jgi:hypothetical protein
MAMIQSMHGARLFLTSLVALAAAPVVAQTAQPAGRVVLAAGAVQLVRGGNAQQVKMGMDVRAGDVIRTAPKSTAQLWLRDGSMIAVRERSEFRLDTFSYAPGAPAAGAASVSSIVKGGARFLTGAVGKANPKAVQVNTRVATIGIRGTGYDLIDCVDQCFEETGQPAKPGLYGSVYEGVILVTNESGETDVIKSQSFFLADRQSALVPLPVQPSFLAEPTSGEGSGKSTADVEPVDVPVDAPAGEMAQVNQLPTDKIANIPAPPPQQPDTLTRPEIVYSELGLGDGVPLSTTGSGYTLVSAEYNPLTGEQNVENSIRNLQLGYSGNTLESITVPLFPSFPGYVIRGYTAQFKEGGSDAGVLAWGRWADGTALLGNWSGRSSAPKPIELSAAQGFHWIVGQETLTLPSPAVYQFSLIGATTPTEARAMALPGWTVTAGSMTADLNVGRLSGNLTLYLAREEGYGYFDLGFQSRGALVAGSGVSLATAVTRLNGSATICTAVCDGVGQILFFGNDPAKLASHAGLTYNFNTGEYLVEGAAVFKR